MSNNKIQIYDQIIKRDADGNILTTADVYSFSNITDSITIANLQNYSNNELDFERMEVGNTVYATDSGLSFRFTDIDDLFVYLGKEEECPDCGPGSIIHQNIPDQFVTIIVPEEEYRISTSCKTCGCVGSACECTEVSEVTIEDRTYTVKVSDAYTITANVTEQSCDPPYLKVSSANGKFLPSYPIICNDKELLVVGSQTEISRNISSGNYIVNRPAIFLSNCETTNCFNYGLYDGAHIGIDRHFNGKRSQDYNDDFIIVCDQGTETKVPIGYMSSYQGIGMNITGYGAATSKILNLKTTGNTQGEFVVYTRGGTEIKTNLPNSDTIRIVNVKNYNANILSISSNTIIYEKNLKCNSVLSVKSYGERYSNSRIGTQYANLDLRTNGTFFLPTGVDNLRFIKPNTSQKEAFSVITISSEGTSFAQTTWPGANVRWPGGVGPANVSSGAILSFINFHDPADTLANNNIWYAFGSANGNYGGGTTFIWDKSNVAAIINVTYSWTSTGGTDLDTRTWLTTPFSSRSWEDRPVGWDFEYEVYIGPKGKSLTLDRITFSGDDVNTSGYETILIPMDTILFNTGELRANNAYVDLHLGAYWYNIRNSGNFTVRITNETYGSSIVFTQNAQHRSDVGIGRNEFAVFRIDMKYLNITRIS